WYGLKIGSARRHPYSLLYWPFSLDLPTGAPPPLGTNHRFREELLARDFISPLPSLASKPDVKNGDLQTFSPRLVRALASASGDITRHLPRRAVSFRSIVT